MGAPCRSPLPHRLVAEPAGARPIVPFLVQALRRAAVKGARGSKAWGARAGGRRRSVPHSMPYVSVMFAAMSLTLIFACHGGSPGRPAGPTALFDLASGGEAQRYEDLPFPNDLFFARDVGGVERIRIGGLDSLMSRYSGVISQAFLQMDGFGTSTTVTFRFDGPLDEASLPAGPADSARAGASVFLLNLEAGERVPVDLRYDETRRALHLIPPMGEPLRPKTRYAAVVTRRVRGVHPVTDDEGPVTPSETIEAILDPESGPASTIREASPTARSASLRPAPTRRAGTSRRWRTRSRSRGGSPVCSPASSTTADSSWSMASRCPREPGTSPSSSPSLTAPPPGWRPIRLRSISTASAGPERTSSAWPTPCAAPGTWWSPSTRWARGCGTARSTRSTTSPAHQGPTVSRMRAASPCRWASSRGFWASSRCGTTSGSPWST